MPRALLLLADGFADAHEQELGAALAQQGFEVVRGGTKAGGTVRSAAGRAATLDKGYLDLNLHSYDLVVLPDGDCAKVFAEHKSFVNIVYSALHKGRVVLALGRSIEALIPAQDQKTTPNPAATGTRILQGEIVKGRRVAHVDTNAAALEKAGAFPTEEPVLTDGPVVTATADAAVGQVAAAAVAAARRFMAITH